MPPMLTGGSLIQSRFHIPDQPNKRNFEAVVYLPKTGELQHYYRIHTRPDRGWEKGAIINTHVPVIGPGCIIQSRYGREGNFEVVVPEADGLAHYWHDNDRPNSPWQRVGVIAPGSTGPGALIQNRIDYSLEMVVTHGSDLYHYRLTGGQWVRTPTPITRRASGPPSLIQSSYGNHLEVAVQEGSDLVLYWREQEAGGWPWRHGGVLASGVTGPAGFVQGSHGGGTHKNFEVVVPQRDRLALFWRDNSVQGLPMRFGGYVAHGVGQVNSAALTVSTFTDRLEVLAQECEDSIFHYYRIAESGEQRWIRSACLRIEEGSYTPKKDAPLSEKVVQLTGDWDYQHNIPTPNITETRCGIRGTDLGVSFEHRGRTYFLFGDTHWKHSALPGTADSIAYTTDPTAWNGLGLTFHRSYLRIDFGAAPNGFDRERQGEYDVPLDGFSYQGDMFVFFSADHFLDRKVMGRSVLTICQTPEPDFERSVQEQPLEFGYLAEFSRWKFINVSVQKVDRVQIARYRLPESDEGLLVWGSGGYRADNLYLAYVPLNGRNLTELAQEGLPVHYFRGLKDGRPQWSESEADAAPLFYPAALGEISVRWNAALRCFVLMYMAGPEDSAGAAVTMRVSRTPYGPWSRRRKLFDWIADGMGRRSKHQTRTGWFIHDPWGTPPPGLWETYPDDLGDTIILDRPGQGSGGAYAPYQLPGYTHGRPTIFLYYLLSTWNPYQVVLMKHALSWFDVALLLGMRISDRVAITRRRGAFVRRRERRG